MIGKYKVSTGLGLVLNNSFSLGKLNVLENSGRHNNILRVHASRSTADYFQGAAATLSIARPLKLTVFASYRPMDATLNKDGSAATLLQTNYHRTITEMNKKDNTHYYDRQTIGSGLQQINSNRLTDLDLQARWKF